ncbi:FliM/FliN family flagellar motor switch protein [Candidatus Solirubrobacter pratensis]|uniref:FliM/FliN family flagellar motor switch protein n=1 Tax=Candidatus Solirubrobacter pratensis TaxID=1298857 RepID=UPI0004254899|nr:FliM/FliN family flagellar motor switch protein [Candidatus Solirubrobacter pratensis]
MSAGDALQRLGSSTAEACVGVLEMFAPGKVTVGDPTVAADAKAAFNGLRVPAVAMSVSYIDGVTGGNVFIITHDGAKKLAAAMMGMEQPEDPDAPELSELEESAVSEAMNQMMAMAAGATSSVLGTEVEIGTPQTKTFTSSDDFAGAYASTPHAVHTSFSICGEPARLVQLIPNAFVIRMSSALDELGSEVLNDGPAPAGSATSSRALASSPSLAGIPVRVWAELGRARMPSAQLVGLPPGAVVELDRQADEPIDLYVNGSKFATGRLVVVDGTDWAVRIDHVLDNPNAHMESGMEVARWPESW